jgi:hypothetical protein
MNSTLFRRCRRFSTRFAAEPVVGGGGELSAGDYMGPAARLAVVGRGNHYLGAGNGFRLRLVHKEEEM